MEQQFLAMLSVFVFAFIVFAGSDTTIQATANIVCPFSLSSSNQPAYVVGNEVTVTYTTNSLTCSISGASALLQVSEHGTANVIYEASKGNVIINNSLQSNSFTFTTSNFLNVRYDAKITISPMNGVLAPHSQQTLNVTVYAYPDSEVGQYWKDIISVIETPPSSQTGGASIQTGVAKIMDINIVNAKMNDLDVSIVLAVMFILIVGIYYFLTARKSQDANSAEKTPETQNSKPRKVK